MAAMYNVFVKLLDGKTATLKFPNQVISGESLKSNLYNLTNISPENQRLVTGTHQIEEKTLITIPNGGFFTVHLLLRLIGGKGGFGSLLRGAATKAGQKKTNNFDACRDMSGRRLRHVNAEKKLEEWKAEAEERQLEKIAEDFIKKKVKAYKKSGSGESEKYIAKYRVDSDKCMEDVEASVKASFLLSQDAKRKILPSSGPASKRSKLWMDKEKGKAEESDSDDEEEDEEDVEEEEKSIVLDGSYAVRNKDGEGSSGSVLEAIPFEGESSGGGSMESNLEEENGIANGGTFEVGEGSANGEIRVEENENGMVKPELVVQCETVSRLESSQSHSEGSAEVKDDVVEANGSAKMGDDVVEANSSVATTTVTSEKNPISEKQLNFDEYNSSTEMEVLGMEKLKAELQVRGLKCGGTLQERASRLFLLKTTPIEKLPKKLLAKK